MSSLDHDVEFVCQRILRLQHDRTKTLVAIAGPPASGKSTLAENVVQKINVENKKPFPGAALLPMDGYHFDNQILEARGLLDRKGAPETFNARGFCDAVKRLKATARETFHPKFDRKMDLSIAQSIAIHPQTPTIVIEGNYLLLKTDPWTSLQDIFDLTILVCPSRDAILDRLQQRWIGHGLSPEAAHQRAVANDLPNADLILQESREADLRLEQNYSEFRNQ